MNVNVKPRIKEWYVRRGKTGKEVAEHLGVSEGRVSEWSKGKGYPRFEALWKMAKFLGCKMDDLYEEIEEENNED
jgi:transcriptional regulator with XRE-family HTH domain